MALSKLFRRLFGSFCNVESYDSDCNLHCGLKQFINSGTPNIIEAVGIGVQLENAVVELDNKGKHITRRSSKSTNRGSSSSSSSSGDASGCGQDVTDGKKSHKELKGVRVTDVEPESFAHGFGLRVNDVIKTVNGKPVESAETAIYLMARIITASMKSRLALEIQRKERGLIRLDNQGDEIEAFNDDELHRVPSDKQTKTRLKNTRFRKYLTVKSSGEICLSNFRTRKELTYFWLLRYQKFSADSTKSVYGVFQHIESSKCLWVEDGEIILKDAPEGKTLQQGSGYLFDIQRLPSTDDEFYFETVTETGKSIGFERRRKPAVLLNNDNEKTWFEPFDSPLSR